MNHCLIQITSLSQDDASDYAQGLQQQLSADQVRLVSTEDFRQEDALYALSPQSYDAQKLSLAVTEGLSVRPFCIVYGKTSLLIQLPEVSHRIAMFIETDPLKAAVVEVEEHLAMLQRMEEQQLGQQEAEELSDQYQQHLQQYLYPQRDQADLVIHYSETPKDSVPGLSRYIKRMVEQAQGAEERSRETQIDELLDRFSHSKRARRSMQYKRVLWKIVVKSTLFIKRTIDIAATLVALLLLSPLILVVSLLIKLTDGGNVFYFQTRVGKQGREFQFPKFRSMVADADKLKDQLLSQNESDGKVLFKMKHDPRVTKIGRFIRRFSIDELPQLWCVLKGDMSLVGPRPPLPREVALYTQEDRRRLEVTPGLTGIWQVSGRSDIGFEDQVKLDVLYIESHSVWLDIKLLFKTVPAVLTGRGAY